MAKAAAAGAAALVAGGVGFKLVDDKLNLAGDIRTLRRMVKMLAVVKKGKITTDYSMTDIWAEAVAKWADNTFVIFEHSRLTFGDMDVLSTQLAHWLLSQGIQTGDVLALLMENKPEFIAWWLAITKIGGQVALINYNIKSRGLIHCVQVASSKAIVFDADTEESVHDVEDQLEAKRFYWGSNTPIRPFKQVATVTHDDLLSLPRDDSTFQAMRQGIKITDNFGFIYTSGTTGLPKAAKIMHVKFATLGGLTAASGMAPGDRLYTCLPIFHSAGGGIGVVGSILTGCTLVLARKFSAGRFWPEIVGYGCTGFQYIGELGRYLVNYAKEHPEVYRLPHRLKMAIGNGLRPEVWDDFQDGFRIPLVVEFYGATEGNGVLMNFSEKADLASRGAVGRAGALVNKLLKSKIAKFNVETEELVRGPDGRCIECEPGEPGELIFPNLQDDPGKSFKGYTDPKATSKKLASDVFEKGDSWFRSGDLLSKDAKGFYFFVDRIGDTFRWKGENCSTMEISEIVSSLPGVEEANVYGVKVPGSMDGRACMVAISGQAVLQSSEKLEDLQKLCQKELPKYAMPLFLRFLPEMEVTGTFKHQKVQLRDQGCDPKTVPDAIFWLSPTSGKYEPFGPAEYQMLENGQSKL